MDLRQDVFPLRLPLVWLRMLVSLDEIALNLSDQLPHTTKAPLTYNIASQISKESLNQVQPGTRRRCEMHMKSRMLAQPRLDLRMLVRAVVVRDQVNIQPLGRFTVDLLEKSQPFHMSVLAFSAADDFAFEVIQRGE